MRPKAVDLFCGAGGMSLGFEQAGFDIILGVDRDAYHCAAHERNFPYGKTLCASVSDLDAKKIKDLCDIEGELDLIFGGPPCQGFSTMGKRNAEDPRNSLVGEFVRIISEIRPKAFVMENVPGMQTGKTKEIYDYVLDSMTNAGYKITLPVQTLLASKYGAPQNRERLFVIGIRDDQPHPALYPVNIEKGQPLAKNVGDAFEGLPEIDTDSRFFTEDVIKYKPNKKDIKSAYAKVLLGIEVDPTDYSYRRKSKSGLTFGNKISRHSAESIALYEATAKGSMVPGHKLPRLDPNGYAPTLRAGSESERGSHTAPRPIHPNYPRCITVREAARLHGYPDWFAFYPVIHHGFRQVGNSVSPFVARAVGKSVIKALGRNSALIVPEEIIELDDQFILSEERKKTERRISHLDEFPKVINWLFSKRYSEKNNNIGRTKISNLDIEQAILETGAKMPRITPESFFSEFSKTRNAKQIMSLPISKGFSLIQRDDGIEFVAYNTPGSIGSETAVSFNSADMKSFETMKFKVKTNTCLEKGIEILKKIKGLEDIKPSRDMLGSIIEGIQICFMNVNPKKMERIVIWDAKASKRVTFAYVERLLANENANYGAAIMSLTDKHIGVIVFEKKKNKVSIQHKKVYGIGG